MPRSIAIPPGFVMWKSVPPEQTNGWQRQWFGNELDATAVFNVRGIGIREPMFNADVHRPNGTGDWLIMLFHEPVRLRRAQKEPSAGPNSLILWPPGAAQYYSWSRAANLEPHSWIHVEGRWVATQVEENRLPLEVPITIEDESLFINLLQQLMNEMTQHEVADPIILQNLFQNWARSLARVLRTRDPQHGIPPALLIIRDYLDEHFMRMPPLDELAEMACMSRSHLSHQFREHFGTTISSYVIRKRMSIAQRLLYDLSVRPGEIAKRVGYPDIYQFSKQFKKTFAICPSEYRKQLVAKHEVR